MSVDGSGFFDPGSDKGGPGYNRLSVKSTGNVIVSNIKFIGPTKISFRLHIKNKPADRYTLVITNPDGQFVVTDYFLLPSWLNSATVATAADKAAKEFVTSSTVYPNPASDEFRLVVNAAKDVAANVIITDISGKHLLENKYQLNKGSNELTLSLANYDKGTYIVAVYNPNHLLIALQKVVKQ